jgi:hypothetical protein
MIRCLAAFLVALAISPPVALAAPVQSIVVFDVELINTSSETSRPEEIARTHRIGEALKAALVKSGRYRIVDLAPMKDQLAKLPAPRDCNGCERKIAKEVGADLAAIAWVQKVSDLILSINLEVEDVSTGKFVDAGSVDIRGNTDVSWDRGLSFLLDETVFSDRK